MESKTFLDTIYEIAEKAVEKKRKGEESVRGVKR